ncbi:MAG: hypothetical protein H6581_19830 [Bacteroidia bacterium]|nr:hypothetical protein [Bacteroidia bacterium]
MERLFTTALLTLLLFVAGSSLYAQSPATFIIKDNGGVLNTSEYESALAAADLNYYRLANARTTMKFSNGMLVELLSGKEVAALNLPVDMDALAKNNADALKTSTFKLHSSGVILEQKNLRDFKSLK